MSSTQATKSMPFPNLTEELKTLPPIPADAREFGRTIEEIKNMIALATSQRNSLQELLANLKSDQLADIRADKQFTNDAARQEELKRRLASSELASDYEARVVELGEGLQRWDARRSRLTRDFEVALIDYEFKVLGRHARITEGD